jgi:hypothetical protein
VGRHRVRVTRWVQIPVRVCVWVSFCTRKRVWVWVRVKFYLVGMGVVGKYPMGLYPLPSLRIACTKDCKIRSRLEEFWEPLGGCPRGGGASHRVFRSTLQGFESIDCRPLTVI